MLHKLKRKLIIIYTASTGIILLISMFIVYQLNLVQLQKTTMENFLVTADSLVNQLQYSSTLSLSSLSVLESEKHMIISVEDNGCPISFDESYQSKTDRMVLLTRLQDAAILQGIHIHNSKHPSKLLRSKVIEIHGDYHDHYYGYVVLIPNERSYISLCLLCSINQIQSEAAMNPFTYTVISFFGILCLFGISTIFIHKVLHPVQVNEQHQVEFVASASHELRSPLAYIQTASSELTEECLPKLDGESAATLSNYIRNTQDECSRMSQLIEDMLLLASADRKTWMLTLLPSDADSFFINSYDTLSYLCEQKQHHLTLSLPEEPLGTIQIDEHRIYQILQILINNASCYTPVQTSILLKPYCRKNHLFIEIIDHGPGIADKYKERIFDRYYRMDSSRTQRNHFGLGLNIAKELAHLHHGELTLSDTDGGGCTFVLKIPIT